MPAAIAKQITPPVEARAQADKLTQAGGSCLVPLPKAVTKKSIRYIRSGVNVSATTSKHESFGKLIGLLDSWMEPHSLGCVRLLLYTYKTAN
jgi:hypothetical protein